MLGAICGDILGSTYEFGIEGQEIFLMHEEDEMTDDWVKGNINIYWLKSSLIIRCVIQTRHMG